MVLLTGLKLSLAGLGLQSWTHAGSCKVVGGKTLNSNSGTQQQSKMMFSVGDVA